MDIQALIIQIAAAGEPLIPVMVVCVAGTIIASVILFLMAGNVWVDQWRFKILGVFFQLSGYGCYRVAISWLRFLMTVYYVVAFRELGVVHYVAYLMVGILYVLDVKRPGRIPKNILWFLVVTGGLYATNLVCGYIHTLAGVDVMAWVVYVCMGIFLFLFAFYLFFQELEDVSFDRKTEPEKEYGKTVKA